MLRPERITGTRETNNGGFEFEYKQPHIRNKTVKSFNKVYKKSVKMPLVSVIIPVFNRKQLLQRAVSSVVDQKFKDYELIVVDDGSTDGLEISGLNIPAGVKFSFCQNRLNTGVSHARNKGVSHSSGKYVAFLDSDDQWHPQKLGTQIHWMKSNPEYEICQTREVWIRNGLRVNPPATHEKIAGDLFEASLYRCMITPSSVLMTARLFNEYGGFNESLPAAEDYDLWLRITSRYRVGLLDSYLLTRFGGHPDQLSTRTKAIDRYRIRALLDIYKQKDLSPQRKQKVREILVKKALILANGCKKRGKKETYEHYKAIVEQYSSN